MIVKRIEDNRLITLHELGNIYLTLKEEEEKTQKFLKSAKNLEEAIERAESLNQECIKYGLGCVIAEVRAGSGERRIIKRKNGKTFVSRRPHKKGTTVWRVYLAPDENKYQVNENYKVGAKTEKL